MQVHTAVCLLTASVMAEHAYMKRSRNQVTLDPPLVMLVLPELPSC